MASSRPNNPPSPLYCSRAPCRMVGVEKRQRNDEHSAVALDKKIRVKILTLDAATRIRIRRQLRMPFRHSGSILVMVTLQGSRGDELVMISQREIDKIK